MGEWESSRHSWVEFGATISLNSKIRKLNVILNASYEQALNRTFFFLAHVIDCKTLSLEGSDAKVFRGEKTSLG